jgi:hypothetical protein
LLWLVLVGVNFSSFLIVANGVWVVTFIVFAALIRKAAPLAYERPDAAAGSAVADEAIALLKRSAVALSATLGDMLLVNLPYVIVPFLFGAGAPLVVFDTGQKVLRATQSGFKVFSEGLLPRWAASLRSRDQSAVLNQLSLVTMLCLVPTFCVGGLLILWGRWTFAFLLGTDDLIPFSATLGILIVVLGALPQHIASIFLFYAGYFNALLWANVAAAALILLDAIVCASIGARISSFMIGYGCVFLAAGAINGIIAFTRVRQLGSGLTAHTGT